MQSIIVADVPYIACWIMAWHMKRSMCVNVLPPTQYYSLLHVNMVISPYTHKWLHDDCMYVCMSIYYVYTPMTTPASSEVRTPHRWGSMYSSSHAWSCTDHAQVNMYLEEVYYRNRTCSDIDLQWRRECIIACSLLCGESGCCCSWCVEGVMSTCSTVCT